MALVTPVANLTYSEPNCYGHFNYMPLSRDWRPSQRWFAQGLVGFIDPPGAFAPDGIMTPTSMASWTVRADYNQKLRQVTIPGYPPTLGWEFYDGAAYAAGTAVTTCVGGLTSPASLDPNLVLRMIRYAPPDGQGIVPQTDLTLYALVRVTATSGGYELDRNGTWTAASVSLSLPFRSDTYREATLSWALGRTGLGYVTPGTTFATHSTSRKLEDGEAREAWSLEYIEDATMFDGGYILIENSSSPDQTWITHNENVRLVAGPVVIAMAGCRQQLNLSPIHYSNATGDSTHILEADRWLPLPSLQWNVFDTWGTVNTAADNWTVTVEDADDWATRYVSGYRPKVAFVPGAADLTTRPIVWLVTEDHEAGIAEPSGVVSQDTDGEKLLTSVQLTLTSKWQGASGSASLRRTATAPLPAWEEGGRVVVAVGWQQEAGAAADTDTDKQDVATMFVAPGGLSRDLSGGLSGLEIQLTDLVGARLESEITNFRQAGWQTFSDWAHRVAHAIGLPDAQVYVAPALASYTIPVGDQPHRPRLWPQDGQQWTQHLNEVCAACGGVRWGWDVTNARLFFDCGRASWVAGTTPDLALDYNSATVKHRPLRVSHTEDGPEYRLGIKIVYGEEGHKREAHYLKPKSERDAAGWVSWAVVDDVEATHYAAALEQAIREHGDSSTLEVEMVLRPKLLPDKFIRIDDCPELGLETGAVYQITQHDLRCEVGSGPVGTSTLTAVRVYSPAAHTAATTNALGSALGAGGM